MKLQLAIIAGMTEARVIGKDNQLPWHLSEDLKRFKALTMGHPIIMGRKTFESIGRPLPGRTNIVVTHNTTFHADGVVTADGFETALQLAATAEKGNAKPTAFVIGGSELFKLALPLADRLYLTMIHHPFPGDTFFPDFNLEGDFRMVEKSEQTSHTPEKFRFTFLTASRK